MITFHEAQSKILSNAVRLETEQCPLSALLNRVLAKDIVSSIDIPPRDNSAMDGFAARAEDITTARTDAPTILDIIEDLPAGQVASKAIVKGQAIRIMTGAQIPDGADCVVPVELTKPGIQNSEVRILNSLGLGEHVRRQGEDVKMGALLIAKGTRLRPQEVGLIAALGMTGALVSKRPVVGLVSSGNELAEPGQSLEPGQIFDANRFSLAAQAEQVNALIKDYGIVEDKLDAVIAVLHKATSECDLVITSGGVSVGDYDLMKQALSQLGQMNFWQVAQKPGKPLAFGHIDGKPVVGLPGNPVSAMVVFDQYLRPLLLKMQGADSIFREQLTAICEQEIGKPKGRLEFFRAMVEWRDGQYHARLTGPQGSGILTSMVRANGLMILPEDVEQVKSGDQVIVELFE